MRLKQSSVMSRGLASDTLVNATSPAEPNWVGRVLSGNESKLRSARGGTP
jgi:hypothetical protein